jgi:two-component system nitrogen regulation response regulator GlnG
VSRLPVRLRYEVDDSILVEASTELALFVDEEQVESSCRCTQAQLERGILLRLGRHVLLWLGLFDATPPPPPIPTLVGESPGMQQLRREILRVASLHDPVLIRGESGTGKELVAAALHDLSRRRAGPSPRVNMAAIPASTGASELFGHGKGAFTGSVGTRDGYFVAAHGGTLFLDEFGKTVPEVQAMLLRAIESGEVQPLGGVVRKVDVRFVAATDADLRELVDRGLFHEPLWRRFGYELHLPPLRARRQDIAELFLVFLSQNLTELGGSQFRTSGDRAPFLSADFVARLIRYDWPGNVRELRHVARQFAIDNHEKERAAIEDKLSSMLGGSAPPAARPSQVAPKPSARELNDAQIAAALQRHHYTIKAAARDLAVSPGWLHARMRSIPGLQKAQDLQAPEIEAALARAGGKLEFAAAELRVSERGLLLRMGRLNIPRGDGNP